MNENNTASHMTTCNSSQQRQPIILKLHHRSRMPLTCTVL